MNWLSGILDIYNKEGLYIKKRVENTVIIAVFFSVFFILINLYLLVLNGRWSISKPYTIVFLIACTVIFFALINGSYLVAQNILYLLCLSILAVLFFQVQLIYFYLHGMMMSLFIAITHVKTYQIKIFYWTINLLSALKIYDLTVYLRLQTIEPRLYLESIQGTLGLLFLTILLYSYHRLLALELDENKKLNIMSRTDALTHLYNRFQFNEDMEDYDKKGIPFVLTFFDIDLFKRVNDSYGHKKGDEVLIHLANLLRDHFQMTHPIYRWGGEEFAVIFLETDKAEAIRIANGFREKVKAYDFNIGTTITVSVGLGDSRDYRDKRSLLIRTDNALYEAKSGGRDRLCLAEVVE